MKTISRILPLVCFLFASGASVASESKISVSVTLPRDISEGLKAMTMLSQYDVAGVDWNLFKATLFVSKEEMEAIADQGLPVKIDDESLNFANNIEKYSNPDEVNTHILNAHAKYPSVTEIIDVGRTTEGRKILGLSISKNRKNSPAVLFNGMLHARELMTTEVNLDIITTLLEGYATNSEIKQWVDSLNIVVVPQVNPDGNNIVFNSKKLWRKNAYTIGNKLTGVDLNRNYPATWNTCKGSSGIELSDTYRGPAPGSEPETKSMMQLVRDLKPIMNISYHAFSELIIYPYGCSNVTNPSEALFKDLGNDMNRYIENDQGKKGTYKVGTAPQVIYQADGSDLDWNWREMGVLAFTIEVNSSTAGFQPDYDNWRDITVARQRGGWQQLLRRATSQSVVARVQGSGLITYRIRSVNRVENLDWSGSDIQSFQLKNQDGLLYQPLLPGKYEIQFFKDGNETLVQEFTLGKAIVDLGTIDL